MDVFARHLSVPHKKTRCRERRKSASHNIGILLLHALRLLRSCERLIIALAVINTLAVLLMHPQLCIAVAAGILRGFFRRLTAAVL